MRRDMTQALRHLAETAEAVGEPQNVSIAQRLLRMVRGSERAWVLMENPSAAPVGSEEEAAAFAHFRIHPKARHACWDARTTFTCTLMRSASPQCCK